MQTRTETAIVQLLTDAGAAHGDYEATVLGGVYDDDWPGWYATYLLDHGLRNLLPEAETLDAARLGEILARFNADHRREQPECDWPAYYSARLGAMLERAAGPGLPAAPR